MRRELLDSRGHGRVLTVRVESVRANIAVRGGALVGGEGRALLDFLPLEEFGLRIREASERVLAGDIPAPIVPNQIRPWLS